MPRDTTIAPEWTQAEAERRNREINSEWHRVCPECDSARTPIVASYPHVQRRCDECGCRFTPFIETEQFRQRPPRELHNVYAYLSTGTKVLVSGELSWDGAQDRWLALDNRRIRLYEGRAAAIGEVRVGDFIGRVQHFCVRSADDPNWPSSQPNHVVRVVLD